MGSAAEAHVTDTARMSADIMRTIVVTSHADGTRPIRCGLSGSTKFRFHISGIALDSARNNLIEQAFIPI
jgi:hypothetical protein